MENRSSGFGAFLIFGAVLLVAAVLLGRPDSGPSPAELAERAAAREAVGGAQTRDDIMARQRGEVVDYDFRRNATGDPARAKSSTDQLGTLGGVSDAEVFRALRYGSADINSSSRGPAGDVIIQDGGMGWLQVRDARVAKYGGWLLLGMTAILAFFYLIRGRVPISGVKTGQRLLRFGGFERFVHWLSAGSFVLLALTGLISMYGRPYLISLMGKDAHATLAMWSKLIHNNVSWAFMIGVTLIFLQWIRFNIPNWTDVKWLMVLGGLFSDKHHPAAGKFNAGQKIIFWTVVLLSIGVSATGLSLLMPFRAEVFAGIFSFANGLGIPALLGLEALPTQLSPQQEMQFAQLFHASLAFLFMAMIIGHIYIGTIGMEGAFDAMGSGWVEEQWAREHHSIWCDDAMAKQAKTAPSAGAAAPSPAE